MSIKQNNNKKKRGLPFSHQLKIDPCYRLIHVWIGERWRIIKLRYESGETNHLMLPDIADYAAYKWPVNHGLIVVHAEKEHSRPQVSSLCSHILKQYPLALTVIWPDETSEPFYSAHTLNMAFWFRLVGCYAIYDKPSHKLAAGRLVAAVSEGML